MSENVQGGLNRPATRPFQSGTEKQASRIVELETALKKIGDFLDLGSFRSHEVDDPFEWISDVVRGALQKPPAG